MGTTLEVEEEGTTTYTVNADDEDQSSAVQHRGLPYSGFKLVKSAKNKFNFLLCFKVISRIFQCNSEHFRFR